MNTPRKKLTPTFSPAEGTTPCIPAEPRKELGLDAHHHTGKSMGAEMRGCDKKKLQRNQF